MIYLMRHGLDDENYVGGYSDVPLINEGINQVEDSTRYIKNLKINSIICSDVLRAHQTAYIISQQLGKVMKQDESLRELDKGLLNGMDKKIAEKLYPKYFKKLTIYDKYPKGECMLDLYLRIKELLKYMDKYENSLLVTHRGVINMIYYILNGIELSMDKERFGVTHASIHELNIQKNLIRRIY